MNTTDNGLPMWDKYQEWCDDLKLRPTMKDYLIWCDENGFDFE